MFFFNAVFVFILGVFFQSHLIKSIIALLNSWNPISIGINLFLAESCSYGMHTYAIFHVDPNDGVLPPVEGHVGDVGDQETQTMIAELLEDDIRRAQTVDTVAGIEALRMTPHELSRMKIPLCRLVPMLMVRPTLASDLIQLEQQFVHGYEEGARVFYVSMAHELS